MHSFISLICSYFLVLLICVQLEVKFGVIEMFLFHTQVSPFRALAVCCLFVVVLPSHGDILSGVQLVTELSNSLVPELFQVSHRTQQQLCDRGNTNDEYRNCKPVEQCVQPELSVPSTSRGRLQQTHVFDAVKL